MDIELKVKFDLHLHDRAIKPDNGWVIKIGRGLDVYQKPESWLKSGPMISISDGAWNERGYLSDSYLNAAESPWLVCRIRLKPYYRRSTIALFQCEARVMKQTQSEAVSYEIQHFKGFGASAAVELKPLTLIYGANSSGKSSLLATQLSF